MITYLLIYHIFQCCNRVPLWLWLYRWISIHPIPSFLETGCKNIQLKIKFIFCACLAYWHTYPMTLAPLLFSLFHNYCRDNATDVIIQGRIEPNRFLIRIVFVQFLNWLLSFFYRMVCVIFLRSGDTSVLRSLTLSNWQKCRNALFGGLMLNGVIDDSGWVLNGMQTKSAISCGKGEKGYRYAKSTIIVIEWNK